MLLEVIVVNANPAVRQHLQTVVLPPTLVPRPIRRVFGPILSPPLRVSLPPRSPHPGESPPLIFVSPQTFSSPSFVPPSRSVAMASREAAMGGMAAVRSALYSGIIKRNSIWTLTLVAAGFAGTNVMDSATDSVWGSVNKGKSWREVQASLPPPEVDDDDE